MDFVTLGSVVDVQWRSGPDRVVRYNMYPSAEVQGDAAPGRSSGQARRDAVWIVSYTDVLRGTARCFAATLEEWVSV